MSTLRRAIEIAAAAHDGQVDRGGAPYILHPLRVMLAQKSDDARIAAVLHDVIEDSDWTMERLADEGFNERVLEAVLVLTKTEPQDYFEYVDRIAAIPLAVEVKRADLTDNLNPKRLGRPPTEEDEARFDKYRAALRRLPHP